MKGVKGFAFKALGALVLVFVLCGYSCKGKVKPESLLTPSSVGPVAIPQEEMPNMDNPTQCLTNENGIRQKAIITRRGVSCSQEPGGVEDGFDLDYFHSYFVFETVEVNGIIYYRVGITPRRANIKGWVSGAKVQLWDTAIGARYARPESDDPEKKVSQILPPLYVYGEKEDSIKAIKSESVEPIAQTLYDYKYKTQMAWPITKKEEFPFQGKTYEVFQIAFLSEYPQGGDINAPPPVITPTVVRTEKQKQVKEGVKTIDVVFVIDTTLSTTPYIEAVKETIRKIMNSLNGISAGSFKPDIAFGLVEYRDFVDGLYFNDNGAQKVYRLFQLTKDAQAFLNRINIVKSAGKSSEGWQEAVLDGLKAGLMEISWSNDYSERILILIGDNSGHSSDSPEIKTGSKSPNNISVGDITVLASRNRATIFSLLVKNQAEAAEVARHLNQFTEFAEKTGGKCFPLEVVGEMVGLVSNRIIDPKIQEAEIGTEVVTAKLRGSSESAIKEKVGEKQYVEVMKWLSKRNITDRDLKPGEIFFSTGWVVSEAGGVKILAKEAYMARSELNLLLTNLQSLKDFLANPKASVSLIAAAYFPRVRENMPNVVRENMPNFLGEEISLPMNVWLQIKGIPLSEYSILKFNKSILEQMPEETRRTIKQRITTQCLPALMNDYNDFIRFSNQDDINSFGWVREKYLP